MLNLFSKTSSLHVFFVLLLTYCAGANLEDVPKEETTLSAGVYLIESVQTKSFLSALQDAATSTAGIKKVKTLLGGSIPQQRWVVIPVGKPSEKTFMVLNEYVQFNVVSTFAIGSNKRLTRAWIIRNLGNDEDGPWQMMDVQLDRCLASGIKNGGEVQFSKCAKDEKDQQWNFQLIRKLTSADSA